jgi:hypothetical protein
MSLVRLAGYRLWDARYCCKLRPFVASITIEENGAALALDENPHMKQRLKTKTLKNT